MTDKPEKSPLTSPLTGKPVKQGSNRTGVKSGPDAQKPGKPARVFDWTKIANMFAIGCNMEEVANVEGVGSDWLRMICERDNGMTLKQFMMKHRDTGKLSLRRAQYRSAVEKGNVQMQIWLGKNWLGQTDKIEHASTEQNTITLNYKVDENDQARDALPSEIGRAADDGERDSSDDAWDGSSSDVVHA